MTTAMNRGKILQLGDKIIETFEEDESVSLRYDGTVKTLIENIANGIPVSKDIRVRIMMEVTLSLLKGE